jgi:cytochrome c
MRTSTAFGTLGIVATVLSCHSMLATHVRMGEQAEQAAGTTRSVWDGVYTAAQAKSGEAIYRSQCLTCHGAKLEGVDDAPSLADKSFVGGWNGLTVGALFEKTRTKMPRDEPGQLSRLQDVDVVAYILSANKFPAGKTELPQEIAPLKLIRIEAAKPESKK